MIYIIVVLILALAFVLGMYSNQRKETKAQYKNSCVWNIKYNETLESYEALDQGMTEITDAYATDVAQYEESIKAGFNQNQHLQGVLTQALDKITLLEKDKMDAQQMALDFQLVATTHDATCLPTLP